MLTKNGQDEKVAAIFLINSKFITGFEVFCYSLKITNSLQGVPLIVVTTDRAVLEDAFVQSVCHDVVFIDEVEAEKYKKIRSGDIPAWRLDESAGAYYFFKFSIFAESRFDRLVYFDVDMVCLNNIDDVLLLANGSQIAGARTYGATDIFDENRKKFAPDKVESIVDRALFKPATNGRPREKAGMNSGLMVLDRSILNEGTKAHLLDMASAEDFTGDQNVVCSYIHRNPEINFQFLPLTYNIPRRILDNASIGYYMSVKDKLKILHYNAGHPWGRPDSQSYVDFIWWDCHTKSREYVGDMRSKHTS